VDFEILTLLVTISLAATGIAATYWNTLAAAKRKERLDLVNRRIADFYGPLFVLTRAGEAAYRAFETRVGRESDPSLTEPLTSDELAEWRVWVKHVFMPLNEARERLIREKAYLIREHEMPECLLTFVTHVSSWKAVIAKWEDGDFTDVFSVVDYPEELGAYATDSYLELKTQQLTLIRAFGMKGRALARSV
jgi:hypothetical protein